MKSVAAQVGWVSGWLLPVAIAAAGDTPGVHWPSFRGPSASGISEGHPTPDRWNVPRGEGLRWKQKLSGLGHSSPVIWGDRLFVTTAVSEKGEHSLRAGLYGDIESVNDDSVHTWWVYCLDKHSGKTLWRQKACRGVPRVKRHTKATHANSTPATDGQRVVAFFGSEGLYCYDLQGKLLWEKDLGLLDAGYYVVPDAQWGFGSSPVLHDGLVIVQCDVQQNSFIMAFDADDGSEVWLTPRKEVPTWGTPTVHVDGDRAQVIANGYRHIGGYELHTGKEIWRLRGGGDIPVPTPVVAGGLIFITSAHGPLAPIYAIRTGATGDITVPIRQRAGEHIAWQTGHKGNYMQTPIVYGDYLYCCRDNGVLTCFQAATGESAYTRRLGEGTTGFTASAVAGDGKLYFTSEEGDVYVVRAGPKFELIATNPLGATCLATPALSEGALYFRTQGHMVCVGGKASDRGKPAPEKAQQSPR
jgi:outer membrane protein assembly factor BamB